jgi:hypothetical protein
MDDADGGRRGLRARPARELSRALADHWGLGPAAEWIDLGGSSSLNLPLSAAERAALPPAMARQALAATMGWVARLDDQAAARRHAARAAPEVAASLRVMADLDHWRDAFA